MSGRKIPENEGGESGPHSEKSGEPLKVVFSRKVYKGKAVPWNYSWSSHVHTRLKEKHIERDGFDRHREREIGRTWGLIDLGQRRKNYRLVHLS